MAESEDFLVPVASIFSMKCEIFLCESEGAEGKGRLARRWAACEASLWKSEQTRQTY